MYRTKKSDKRASAAVREAQASPTGVEAAPNMGVPFAESVMAFKARLMAPFMLFDKTIRQVVPNPSHDRVLRSEVSRVQGVVLRELRLALERESTSTPKEALHAVQKSVMLAYASCAVSSDMEALVPLTSDEEAAAAISRLETAFAEKSTCAKAVASLAAVLSTGIVRDSYSEACRKLEARLTAEMGPLEEGRRTEEERLALQATKRNIQDFVQLRGALVTAFDAISAPFNENGTTPLGSSAAADVATSALTVQSYFSLLGWVLMVQPERLGLAALHTTPSLRQVSKGTAEKFAKVTHYSAATGKVVIERVGPTAKWGVMLNSAGALVGLENTLRNATPAGDALYFALQQQTTGLPIIEINGYQIGTDQDTGANSERWERIRNELQDSDRMVSLTVAKVDQLSEPQEIAFDILPQGGEGASGQQVALILKRPSTGVQWQLKMRIRAEGVLALEDFSKTLPLSPAATKFLTDHRGHLLIVNANGCDVSNSDLLMEMIRSSLYLVLRIRVVDDVERLVATATGKTEGRTEEAAEGTATAAVAAAPQQVWGAVEEEDAEVAEHRALLEKHHIDPDEPLPEVTEDEAAAEVFVGKKKGRPKKVTASEEVLQAVDEETSIEEAQELPLEATAVEEVSEKKRRGRSKKVTVSEEVLQAVDEETPIEEAQELPLEATAEEEVSEKKKRGRSKKAATAQEALEAAVVEDTPMEEVQELPLEAAHGNEEVDAAPEKKKKGHPKKAELGNEAPKQKKRLSSKKAAKKAKEEAKKRAKEEKKRAKEAKKKAKGERAEATHSDESGATETKGGEAVTGAAETLEAAAQAQGVLDTPLIDVKPTSDLAAKISKKVRPKEEPAAAPADTASLGEVAQVSPTELADAPPLTFENAVTLDKFDGAQMELRRPDLKTPWDMKMSLGGDNLVLTRLPPISAALKTHPFLKSLQPDTDGHIKWRVDAVNGTDLTSANKTLRAQALESIKKANKISLLLRQIAK
ncbi:hypothetical protein DQ04_08691000 [Trypanosoma grayi]|uniref:hypothetical protein n=1 Tax=Trypanosoma grayi TaxID=71804 RepID=UPI0004F43407|nr:hypothetical protein DQ04_08691000 [Trypanosoma grayi]KEG07835.1 hypothetical protein DQ04_08691000 [Trypanosoma grayi]